MEASLEPQARYDLAEFGLKDMIPFGRSLRLVAKDADTMEDAAGRIVRFFYETLSANGETNCALVRCFKTHRHSDLPVNLKKAARQVLLQSEPRPNLPSPGDHV